MARTDPGASSGTAAPGPPPRHLLVRLGAETHRLPAGAVLEILEPLVPVRLPGAPPAVLGIVNHRGKPVTLVDLGLLLAREPAAANPRHRVVVLRWGRHDLALAVEDVSTLEEARTADGPTVLDLDRLLGPIF